MMTTRSTPALSGWPCMTSTWALSWPRPLTSGTSGVFLAAHATVKSIGLVGVPGITMEANNLEVAVNLSAGAVTDLEVIDFKKSFDNEDHDGDGTAGDVGLAVKAGADKVVIDFENLLIKARGSVRIGIDTGGESWFGINADLDFELTDTHLQVFVNGKLYVIRESSPFFELSTTGLFVINGDGLAMKLNASLTLGLGEELGIDLQATFKITFNTTEKDVVYEIPDHFIEVPDEETVNGKRTLTISKEPYNGYGAAAYLFIEADGYLQILDSFKMTGYFGFLVTSKGDLEISVDATISILGASLRVRGRCGHLLWRCQRFRGRHRDQLRLRQRPFRVGFELSGTFTLKVNTTAIDRTFSGVKVEAYSAEIGIDATLVLMDFLTLTGSVTIKVSGSGFSFDVDATLALTGLGSFTAVGSLDVSTAGIVASLELTGSLDFAVVEFNGRFHFAINTTSSSQSVKVLDVNQGSGEVAGFKNQTIAAQTLMISFGGELCV